MSKPILGIDLETASAADLTQLGAWAYSLHASTRVWCVVFGFATADGDYRLVRWQPGEPIPTDVARWITDGGPVLAHNSGFEIAIWSNILLAIGMPPIAPEQWHDTQPLGLAMNLPASLDGLAHALGCPIQKDAEGSKLMRKMAALQANGDGGWSCDLDTPDNRRRLLAYCDRDVGAMLDCYYRLPELSITEQAVWRVDQRINARGVFLDQKFAASCAAVAEERRRELDVETFAITAGDLADSRATPALKKWVVDTGVELPTAVRRTKQPDGKFKSTTSPTCDRNAVVKLLEDPNLPATVRAVLNNRTESNKVSSLSKLKRVPLMVGGDGRLRNSLAFQGASTGRWASYGLQVHNLAKNKMGPGEGDLVRSALSRGDLDMLKFAVDQPLDAISQSIRSVVRAAPGHELIAADYSAIEARVIAWIAGQSDVLRLFEAGTDVYVYAANNVGSDSRQLGKVCVLALGYGMGALKFLDTCARAGIHLDPKDARRIQNAWREANAATVQFWHDIESAARDAVANQGTTFRAGRVSCVSTGSCLFLRLPSGRALRYWRPQIVTGGTKKIKTIDDAGEVVEYEVPVDELRYFAPKGAAMISTSTYGGKLAENVTQAIARDLLAEALIRIDAVEPYALVMHVHDSAAAEVPTGAGDVDEFCKLMATLPSWATGCPIAVEGYRDVRFRG